MKEVFVRLSMTSSAWAFQQVLSHWLPGNLSPNGTQGCSAWEMLWLLFSYPLPSPSLFYTWGFLFCFFFQSEYILTSFYCLSQTPSMPLDPLSISGKTESGIWRTTPSLVSTLSQCWTEKKLNTKMTPLELEKKKSKYQCWSRVGGRILTIMSKQSTLLHLYIMQMFEAYSQ